ncbi:MAG: prephenate dehydrogenase [bacterium]
MKKSLGIIGFGNFGKFMVKYLSSFFDICIYDKNENAREDAARLNMKVVSLEEAATQHIILMCIPINNFEEVILQIKDFIKPGALVADVSSTKMKPVQLMEKYLPKNVEILGTHPLFGPESGKDGIVGLKIVLCPVRVKNLEPIKFFLSQQLKLEILIRTPEEHDRQMAYVQGLTHFIGRAIKELDIPDLEQKTMAYQKLLAIKEMLGGDSDALFLTIEKGNYFAKEVREKFMRKLEKIEKYIEESKV